MIYVGIDIAKLNHFASIISSDGEVLVEPFKFSNDSDGFRLLLSKLNQFESDSLVIGLESTAHYGNNLPGIFMFVSLIRSKRLLCEKTTFARQKRIVLTRF